MIRPIEIHPTLNRGTGGPGGWGYGAWVVRRNSPKFRRRFGYLFRPRKKRIVIRLNIQFFTLQGLRVYYPTGMAVGTYGLLNQTSAGGEFSRGVKIREHLLNKTLLSRSEEIKALLFFF